jgi:hypothetical protein
VGAWAGQALSVLVFTSVFAAVLFCQNIIALLKATTWGYCAIPDYTRTEPSSCFQTLVIGADRLQTHDGKLLVALGK